MKKSNGLLALLGIGAYAYYKYSKMSKDDKAVVNDQLNEVKRIFSDVAGALSDTANQKIHEVKETVDSKISQGKEDLNNLKDKAMSKVDEIKEDNEFMYD